MCGLTGVFHYATRRPPDPDVLARMTDAIAHRGPDGDGVWIDPEAGIGLGHRRLAIIDLTTGDQPMWDASGSVGIIFNGEIYNFRELRAGLEAKGRSFRTRSDTEVILELYKAEGEAGFARMNGIFAFALWDRSARRLVCARDHLGVKPFYYNDAAGTLLFGSEIKAILAHPAAPRDVDETAIAECLAFRYVPSPRTVFRGIAKLPPGHVLACDGRGVRVSSYWNAEPRIERGLSLSDAIPLYQEKLAAAVTRQMVSDVPVGLMLSGGVDSAVVAAIMSGATSERVKSFTVGFEGGERTNELAEARATAALFGLEHHEVTVSARDYQEFFRDFIWHQEEPLGNESAPAVYFVSRLARSKVKVLLSGQGADEPLAGYDRYKGERYSGALRRAPLSWMLKGAGALPVRGHEKLRRSLYALGEGDTARRFLAIYSIFTPELQARLWREPPAGLRDRLAGLIDERRRPAAGLDPLAQMLYVDLRLWLPDDLLNVGDKMSMATSIELRVPFLDLELIAFLESLPSSFKLRRGIGKYIHKEACRKWLPAEITHRKKKGFSNPVERWMRQELAGPFEDLIASPDSLTRRFFDERVVRALVRDDREGRANYKRHVFLLFMLELWNRTFIAGGGRAEAAGPDAGSPRLAARG